ncbi:unnamed protein product [Owenia fusiformis]|uniref:UBX domain-containing protein 11 n=1 Tax=Owenia fusiformis TaxID=6347 RepID=A0A8J1TBR6_OWEFU|nr:unnamed protein product [Owenia fusiformis]
MSSPLSSLKKSSRKAFTPPQGPQPRAAPFRSPDYSVEEAKLLDEITGNMTQSRGTLRDPFAGGRHKPGELPKIPNTHTSAAPSDGELMTVMMGRLGQLEQRIQFQAKEIIERDQKIKVLQDKVKLLNKSKENAERHSNGVELEKKILLLEQQIYEMEQFLADYGLVWVGAKDDPNKDVYNDDDDAESHLLEELPGENDEEPMWRPETSQSRIGDLLVDGLKANAKKKSGSSQSQRSPRFKVDYNLILENIKDLNTIAGEGEAKIQHTMDGARLKMPDPISLTLYANGIMLFAGPFRPFTNKETQQCLRDLMEGYFPSELQQKYPDGVPIAVKDLRDVKFKDREHREKIFAGQGQMLGGDSKPSRLVPSNLEKGTVTDEDLLSGRYEEVTSTLPGPQLSMDQFLNKLPSNVIKDGKIIDIRNSIGETFQGGKSTPNNITVVDTDVVKEMKQRLDIEKRKRPPTPRGLTTLRIKSETGDRTYVLKMRGTDTIGMVREYLSKQRPLEAPSFDILSPYPRKVFSDNSATLLDCGLTPNAALHLKPINR